MDINELFRSGSNNNQTTQTDKRILSLVSYLNTKPLIYGLESGQLNHDFTLQKDVPSECSRRLLSGEVSLGIIPSVEYARARGKLKIVPDLSISSFQQVNSVELFFNKDLNDLKTVAVDTSSRTSVALLNIILREKYELMPEFKPMAPDLNTMLEEADAALIIGDKALHYQVDWPGKLDLANEWFDLTGLPFVFALWCGPENEVQQEDIKLLQESYALGSKHIDEISKKFADGKPQNWTFYARYLRENISFHFGPEEQEGLNEFFRYAFYYGLIEHIPDLHFYDK